MLEAEGIEEIYVPASHPALKTSDASLTTQGKTQSPVKEGLIKLRDEVLQCVKCSELAQTRNSVVFGTGSAQARLMLIGEAPGKEEDLQGLPFVGQAGQLLTKIIESIGLSRRDVFIANVLKCRPPGNRQPAPEEIANCQGYLFKQIEWIKPQIICCLGTFAAQTLLKTQNAITSLRGKFYSFGTSKVICTYHPAYLLRNPSEKRKVWEDMKMIKKELDSAAL